MATKPEIPALTGLRGIAALLVVAGHYVWFCAPFSRSAAPRLYEDLSNVASFGMSLFFVLSGFVITYNYADFPWRIDPLRSFGRFMYMRLSRLYPALLLFMLFVAHDIPETARDQNFWKMTALNIISAQTWIPILDHGVVVAGGTYHISWSISTEIMMYMMFAAAMIVAVRSWFGIFALAILMIAILWTSQRPEAVADAIARLTLVDQISSAQALSWFFYLSPWFRIVDFAAGSAAAFIVMTGFIGRWPRIFGTLAAAAAAYIVGFHIWRGVSENGGHFVHTQLLSTAVFAAIVLASGLPTRLNWCLTMRPVIFIGTVSYSLYLFHILAPRILGYQQVGEFSTWAVAATLWRASIALLVAVAIATVIYFVVERPAQRCLRFFVARPG